MAEPDGRVTVVVDGDDSGFKETLSDVEKEAKETAKGLDDLGDSAKDSGKQFSFADVAAGNLVSNGLTALISGVADTIKSFIALADETREYREDMAKLKTAFKDTGKTTAAAQKAYDSFYKLLGESDRTVEAVNHLAELTNNEKELSQWSTIAAGVMAKFGDSLPIEGLTEAANETAKVGAVTGSLADALNWAGISEDAFNEKLAKCNSEQERAALITDTLNKEYAAAAKEYNELTASTQAARDATNNLEQAQAAIGAQIEPLTTAWNTLKAQGLELLLPIVGGLSTGIADLTNNLFTNKAAVDQRADAARSALEAVRAEADAYKELKVSQFEQIAGDLAQIENSKLLFSELQNLVDANGRVNNANKDRAAFIASTLSEALGIEISLVGNQIKGYQDLKASIEEAIAAKQAEILLAGDFAAYTEALENRTKKEQEQADKAVEISKQRENVINAENEFIKAQAELAEAAANVRTEADGRALAGKAEQVQRLERVYEKEKGSLSDLEKAYDENEELLNSYYKEISSYQEAQTLIMKGETEKAIELLNRKNSGFYDSTEIVGEATEKQKKHLEELAIAAGVNAELMKERYKNGVDGVTKEMVKTAEKAAETAKTEFEKIGGQIGDGIGKGAEDKKPGLLTKIKNIVAAMKKAAEDEADINSPSKEFAYVGEMMMLGLGKGVDDNAKEPVESVSTVFDLMNDAIEKRLKDQKKTVSDYNDELRGEIADHGKKLADLSKESNEKLREINNKYAEEKKKKGADEAALEKKRLEERRKAIASYNTSVEAENQRHAGVMQRIEESMHSTITSKMQELVNLGETYKDEAKKLWEDLDASILQLQSNYDAQIASRAKSIAESLGLWAEATKNAISAQQLTKNLESQISVLETYNAAIAKLEERNVSTVFVNHLKQLGVSSAGEIETISKMTDKELEGYVKLWEEKYALAHEAAVEELEPLKAETEKQIADMTDAAVKKYDEMREKFKEEGEKLAGELEQAMIDAGMDGYSAIEDQIDTYTQAGTDLMDGVVLGVVNGSPALESAVSASVQRAIEAAKNAAGIASPSKVMKKEVGANLAEGVNVGWSDRVEDIKKQMAGDMQGIIARVQATVGAENAKAGAGLTSRDSGMYDLVRAVGNQTAGINSLAGEYRRGAGSTRPVVLQLNGRELGRAVVDVGGRENARIGTTLALGNV